MASDLVLIDGEPGDARLSIFDDGLLRGDGCFEAIRSYDGRAFAVDEHYRRLAASAAALGIPVPAATELGDWIERVAAAGGDCIVRVVLTRGETVPGHTAPSRCVVLSHSIPSASPELNRAIYLLLGAQERADRPGTGVVKIEVDEHAIFLAE